MGDVRVKRIYKTPDAGDGFRILVDRLWPRGMTKERAAVDLWLKDVAPSAELRSWWHHVGGKPAEFEERYLAELDRNPALEELRALARDHDPVTLLFAARDEEHNHALMLRDLVR